MTRNLLIMLCLGLCGWGQTTTKPCDSQHSGQFDFWIGEWDVFDPTGAKVGENSIQPMYDGCVLQEKWTGSQGSRGSSFNFYNPQKKKWQQFWVWAQGTTLELEGQLKDKAMVLEGITKGQDGKKVYNRITWTPNADGSVRQHWETSADQKNYATAFDGIYRKKS